MAWLKMDCCTPEKPEVLAITAAMGWDDPDLTVGKLFRVWRWFDQHTVDGNAASVSPALLDRIACVSGFASAMQSAGWLTVSEQGLSLPNFDRHCGETAKKRALTAQRVARHAKKAAANAKPNAEPNADGVSQALPREEERREEDSVSNDTDAPASKSPEEMTKDELWSAGKSLLSQAGMPAAQCGSFVGKLVKDHGPEIVVEAVRAAVVERPADPASYLRAACKQSASGHRPVNRQEALEQRNRNVAAEWLAQQGEAA